METFILFVAPGILFLFLLVLPFLSGSGEKSARKRPVAVLAVVTIFLVLGVLTYMGKAAPWSPHMDAWSSSPVPPQYLKDRSPLELRGAAVLQNKQCRNCHSLGGGGPKPTAQVGSTRDEEAGWQTGPAGR